MKFSEEYYLSTKNDATPVFFKLPGVVGIAVGPKIVAGKLTRIPAIQVYVTKKRADAQIQQDERIPPFFRGIPTDVLEGSFPTCASATVRCKRGTIANATTNADGLVEITSAGHGLSDGIHVRIFGVYLSTPEEFPVAVKDNDTFTLPKDVTLVPYPIADFAFWTELCSFDEGLCCCPTGSISGATATNPVQVTSSSHGLQRGDRIKIAGKEFVVGKVLDPNTFELAGTDGSLYAAGPGSATWEKLCLCRSGPIQSVKTGASVVFSSQGHPLKPGDRVHILTIADVGVSSWKNDEPYTVATTNGDQFTVKELSNVGSETQTTLVGCWIRILADRGTYNRIRGGIRIAMDQDVITSPGGPLINQGTTTGSVIKFDEKVSVKETITYGTLGCIAVENGTGNTVLLSNYHVLYSSPGETHVHHPDYSPCKSHRIAEVMRYAPHGTSTAPGTADAAIAKLTDPAKADPKIVDIGDVQDTKPLTIADVVFGSGDEATPVGYRVRKRGITTLVTEGVVTGLSGVFQDTKTGVFLNNQLIVQPLAGPALGAFALKGDSGAVVVDDDNKVVGLLVGNDANGNGYASPIADVETQLGIKVLASGSGAPASGGTAPTSGGTSSAGGDPADDLVVVPSIPDLISQVTSEMAATRAGARLLAMVLRHYREVEQLVHHNRRMTVVWHRNAGPTIFRDLHAFVVRRDSTLPEPVKGRSTQHCLEQMFAALREYGAAALVADVERHGDEVLALSSLTYAGILNRLADGGGGTLHA